MKRMAQRRNNHKVKSAAEALVELLEAKEAMASKKCDICDEIGHKNSYCWFNSQLYSLCCEAGLKHEYSLYRTELFLEKKMKKFATDFTCKAQT